MHQRIKTFSLYSIKRLFKLVYIKNLFHISVLILFCTTNIVQSREIKPELVKCSVSRSIYEKVGFEFLRMGDKSFEKKFELLGLEKNKEKYNIFVSNGTKSRAGHKLKFDKSIKKFNKINLYFTELEPPVNSLSAAVLTYPYCFLNINSKKKINIYINNKKIKKKRSKFFPFSVFH